MIITNLGTKAVCFVFPICISCSLVFIEFFSREAEKWDERPGLRELAENVVKFIKSKVSVTKDMTVLDFGCGSGLIRALVSVLESLTTGRETPALD
jgi:hypothetical protein